MHSFDCNQILDLDMVGTMHSIVDYDIPFVPLVLNGYFNYAGPSINIADSKSVNWHMLKAIETGSNIQFTFTNDQTTKLIKTEYNYLISTYYLRTYLSLFLASNKLIVSSFFSKLACRERIDCSVL